MGKIKDLKGKRFGRLAEKLMLCPFCGVEARLQLTYDEGHFKDKFKR